VVESSDAIKTKSSEFGWRSDRQLIIVDPPFFADDRPEGAEKAGRGLSTFQSHASLDLGKKGKTCESDDSHEHDEHASDATIKKKNT
jgi:hypothetical protein